MGRGLSELQKWMLARAVERPDRTARREGGCDLTIARVLHEFYEIPIPPQWKGRPLAVSAQVFTDLAQQARAHRPAVLRAIQRLQERGLVEWTGGEVARWAGMDLTPAGKSLVVKPNRGRKGRQRESASRKTRASTVSKGQKRKRKTSK